METLTSYLMSSVMKWRVQDRPSAVRGGGCQERLRGHFSSVKVALRREKASFPEKNR